MRYFGWLAAGFGLLGLSRVLERMGDLAPMAASGASGERLAWHLTALVIVVVALACFVRAGKLIWRSISGRGGPPKPARLQPGAATAEPPFDPDAALARYLESKPAEGGTVIPTRPAGGFGRRGL